MTFKEFAVIAVSFGNEMKLGYPQRLTLKAHRDNDGKTKIKSWAKLMGRSRVRERKRKEKGEEGEKLSSEDGLLALERTGGVCGGGREG